MLSSFDGLRKQQNWLVGHIESHDCARNRHGFDLFGSLGHDRRGEIFRDFLILIRNRVHHPVGDFLIDAFGG